MMTPRVSAMVQTHSTDVTFAVFIATTAFCPSALLPAAGTSTSAANLTPHADNVLRKRPMLGVLPSLVRSVISPNLRAGAAVSGPPKRDGRPASELHTNVP